jgi:hypothetical protein
MREVTPSLVKTLPKWYWTVRGDRNSRVAISGFDSPSAASQAICASCVVSSAVAVTGRLRAVGHTTAACSNHQGLPNPLSQHAARGADSPSMARANASPADGKEYRSSPLRSPAGPDPALNSLRPSWPIRLPPSASCRLPARHRHQAAVALGIFSSFMH